MGRLMRQLRTTADGDGRVVLTGFTPGERVNVTVEQSGRVRPPTYQGPRYRYDEPFELTIPPQDGDASDWRPDPEPR